MTGLTAKELQGLSTVDIGERFRWRIDPQLLLFRQVCGRVVKKDPATGVEYPVPFATVHIEDTDCSFLGYFPLAWPWGWFFPLFCRREEIATVVTDECGRFCVWIPRWEIDWILRFRRERVCFPDIFLRPSIRDLLDELRPMQEFPRPPIPEPDPPPFLLKDGGMTLRRAEELVGRQLADRLASLEAVSVLGADRKEQFEILDKAAFDHPLPPPLPDDLKSIPGGDERDKGKMNARFAELAQRFELDAGIVEKLDLRRFVGPFLRCHDVIVPEWMPLLDVPDITFRVTQDVDGDGDQDVIYAESHFDVRWNSGNIPDADPIAVAGLTCDTPEVPCENVPAITFAGLMPLVNPPAPAAPYHDAGSGEAPNFALGYARRPNRPHPNGLFADPPPNPLAKSPYTGTLLLYGCNHATGAVFYRLRYSYNGGPPVPFTGLTWPLYRLVGGVLQTTWPTSDGAGWYPILPDSDGWTPQHLLLSWPTTSFPDGLYTVQLELGNAGKTVTNTSASVRFRIDNSSPTAMITALAWRVAGTTSWTPLELICPVVTRPMMGGSPVAIEFRVSYQVSATHLRALLLSGGGCGGGAPLQLVSPNWSEPASPVNPYQHWHTDPDLDNSEARTAIFSLPGTSLQGAYSFSLYASSRAFNPSDPTGFTVDWNNYDPGPNYVIPSVPVAVVNA
jgi:hypothetical protein